MFLNIFNQISNAFNKPSKYADGGNLGGKKYYLTGYSATASEDSYEEGELKQVSDWEVRDSKVFNTKEQLVEYINKHIIYKDYDVADFDWETGEGENIQTDVLCAYDDYNGYFPADKSEIEQWKKGKKKLYNVHYFIYVTAAIPTEYANGGGVGEKRENWNNSSYEEKYKWLKKQKSLYPEKGDIFGMADVYARTPYHLLPNNLYKLINETDKFSEGGGVAKGWTDAEKSDMEAQFGEGGKMRWWSVTLKMPNGEIANEYVVAGNRSDAIYHGGLTDSAREGGKVLSVKFQGVEEYAKGGEIGEFNIGQSVIIRSDNDNENYKKYRGKELVITHKATNKKEHRGYDSGMEGQGLYDFFVRETGEKVPFSLYDYEIEQYAKGGNVRKKRLTDKYKYVPNYMVQEVEVERNGKTTTIDGSDVLDGFYVKKGVKYAKGGGIKG